MSNIPENLRYMSSHEWAGKEEDGTVLVGITDHAQDLLGDLVYVELPELGREINVGEECVVVESVKAASDVYAPVSGEIVAINDALADTPELINQSPYGDGWIVRIKPSEESEFEKLLDANAYGKALAEEGE